MVAVWWSVLGALVVIIVQIGFALVIRPREAVHALVSDHEFGPWTDVWRVDQRDFGGQKVGRVLQRFRALVEGVPVELLHEGDQRVRANGRFWSVVAQVPHDLAFTLGNGGVTGTVPAGCEGLVAASTDGRLDALLCANGFMVVRARRTKDLDRALAVLISWVIALRPAAPGAAERRV